MGWTQLVLLQKRLDSVTYAEVAEKIKEFRALFTASGLTVLTDLHCAFVGIAKEEIWMESTRAVGGSGRTYDQSLFCRDDRMVWAKGMTERDRGREMENWGMQAVKEVFGFMYNDLWSNLHQKDIRPKKPNVCYLMPVRFFADSPLEFSLAKADLKIQSNNRTQQQGPTEFADLGQHFKHPC